MRNMATSARKKTKDMSVAGRTVYIRHATAWDVDAIRNERLGGAAFAELDPARTVVAVEGDSIIGFGVTGSTSEDGAICVTVFERHGHRGIGSSIVRHVLETMAGATRSVSEKGAPRMIVSQMRTRHISTRGWTSSACIAPPGRPGAGQGKKPPWKPRQERSKSGP